MREDYVFGYRGVKRNAGDAQLCLSQNGYGSFDPSLVWKKNTRQDDDDVCACVKYNRLVGTSMQEILNQGKMDLSLEAVRTKISRDIEVRQIGQKWKLWKPEK